MKRIFPLLFALTLLVGCSPQKAAVTPKPTPEGITPTPEPTPAPTQFRFTQESFSGPKTVKTFYGDSRPALAGGNCLCQSYDDDTPTVLLSPNGEVLMKKYWDNGLD